MASVGDMIAIQADPDDSEDFDITEVELAAALAARQVRRNNVGRPRGSDKQQVTIRLDKAVLAHFRAGGVGWQTRLNEALRKAVL